MTTAQKIYYFVAGGRFFSEKKPDYPKKKRHLPKILDLNNNKNYNYHIKRQGDIFIMPLFEGIEQFENVSPALQWAIFIVGALIVVAAIVSVIISIWLSIRYVKYNRRQNSAHITGSEAARRILDNNGLQKIKVSVVGSLLFGNSYSHYFKKVRLRRLTNKKTSITSLAMGAEKSALAILDKEGDKDMKTRIALTPFIYFGPTMFIPIIIVGVLLDVLMFGMTGFATVISAAVGLLLYVISFVMSIMVLKTEVKAQERACVILKQEGLANDEEIGAMKELFKLYNIQYVNDMILEMLELIMRILMLLAKMQNNNSSND